MSVGRSARRLLLALYNSRDPPSKNVPNVVLPETSALPRHNAQQRQSVGGMSGTAGGKCAFYASRITPRAVSRAVELSSNERASITEHMHTTRGSRGRGGVALIGAFNVFMLHFRSGRYFPPCAGLYWEHRRMEVVQP